MSKGLFFNLKSNEKSSITQLTNLFERLAQQPERMDNRAIEQAQAKVQIPDRCYLPRPIDLYLAAQAQLEQVEQTLNSSTFRGTNHPRIG